MARFIPAFERFVAPARPHAELWRIGAGFAALFIVYYAGVFTILPAAVNALGELDPNGRDPASLLVILSTFVPMAMGVGVAARLFHARYVTSLIGPLAEARRDFIVAAVVSGVLLLLSLAIWALWFDALPGIGLGLWLALLPLSLLGLLIQTGAEELIFRGYLQQQLAARFVSPLAWAVAPSLLFALAHYDVEVMGENTLVFIAATGIFALIAADLTARTGTIGAAWGLHFANNVAAVLLIGAQDSLNGLALGRVPYLMRDPVSGWLVFLDIAIMLCAWAILRRLLSR